MGRFFVSLVLFAGLISIARAEPAKESLSNLCQQLATYQPSKDVEYKSGEDAHGKAVAPADLSDTPQIKMPDNVDVDITFDKARQLGLTNVTSFTPQAYIGHVRVTKEGDVYFNDQRISQTQQQVLCKDASKALPPPAMAVPQAAQPETPPSKPNDFSCIHCK